MNNKIYFSISDIKNNNERNILPLFTNLLIEKKIRNEITTLNKSREVVKIYYPDVSISTFF